LLLAALFFFVRSGSPASEDFFLPAPLSGSSGWFLSPYREDFFPFFLFPSSFFWFFLCRMRGASYAVCGVLSVNSEFYLPGLFFLVPSGRFFLLLAEVFKRRDVVALVPTLSGFS